MEFIMIKRMTTLGSLICLVALILIFQSDSLGKTLADNWVIEQGGSADISNYQDKVKANTNKFLIPGSILLGIGVTTLVFTYYKFLNLNKTN